MLCIASTEHLHHFALHKGGAAQQARPGPWKGVPKCLDRPQTSWFCRQNPASTRKESPAGSWCCCFSRRKPSSGAKRQLQRNAREPSETEVIVLAGELSPCQPTRSRASSSDALCASISGELLGSTNHCSSNGSLPCNISDGQKELIHVRVLISPSSAEDADLSLPATAVTSLACNPVPSQCSPSQTWAECSNSSTSMQEQVSISEEEQSLLEGDLQSGLQFPGTGQQH
ncbi:rho GTPase-activating protein 32-like [Meleagris gallopavo]|uniref:rho GTPase-activating protein 32-like n=1 Tax=Meleagris gallopavo TaxID=9103 RepID=UPI00093EEE0A|nr:rho GTPase-activating protein 32-like [Meleagris gallopavo]